MSQTKKKNYFKTLAAVMTFCSLACTPDNEFIHNNGDMSGFGFSVGIANDADAAASSQQAIKRDGHESHLRHQRQAHLILLWLQQRQKPRRLQEKRI